MQKYRDNVTIVGRGGLVPVRNATATVYVHGTTSKAVIYTNAERTPKANPFQADSLGVVAFYAENGHYDILVQGEGQEIKLTDVLMEDVYEDVEQLEVDVDKLEVDVVAVEGVANNALGIANNAVPKPDLSNATDPAKGASMVGYRGRTLADVMGDVKNVRNFGAVGDGSTNDSAAIQAALNDGGVILFPEGVYNVPVALQVVQDGTTLISEGAKLTSNTSSVVDVISAVGITGLRISGFEIDGRRDLKAGLGQRSGRGIRLLNCHDVQVSNCLVYHCIEHGMVNSGTTGNPTQEHSRVIVSNCIFRDNGNPQTSRGVGIWGGWWRARDVVISGNVFVDNEGGGIFVDDVSGSAEPDGENRRVAITGNVIYTTLTALADPGGTHMGIGYAGSTDFTITGNYVEGYAVALLLDDSQANAPAGRGVVSGNFLKGYNRAIRIDNASSVLFSGNRLEIFEGGSTLVYAVNDRAGGSNVIYDLTFSGNAGYTSNIGYDFGRTSVGTPTGLLYGIKIINDAIKFTGASPATSGQYGIYIRSCPGFEINGVSVSGFYNNINVEPFGPDGIVKGAILKDAVNYNATVTDIVSYKDCIMSGAGNADLRVNGSGNVPAVMLMGNWFRSPTPTSVSGGTLNTTRSGNHPAI